MGNNSKEKTALSDRSITRKFWTNALMATAFMAVAFIVTGCKNEDVPKTPPKKAIGR